MKHFIYLFFSCFLFISCSDDNLYDFKDLTRERDYIYLVRFHAKDSVKKMEFKVKVTQTNGYDQLVESLSGGTTGGNDQFVTYEYSVKGYKKNGVLVTPVENIERIRIILYKVGSTDVYEGIIFQHISDNPTPIYVGYDFQNKEEIIEYRTD